MCTAANRFTSYNIIPSDLTCKTMHVKVLFVLLSNKVLLLLPQYETSSREKLFPCRLIIIIIIRYIAHVLFHIRSYPLFGRRITMPNYYSMVVERLYNDSYSAYDFNGVRVVSISATLKNAHRGD